MGQMEGREEIVDRNWNSMLSGNLQADSYFPFGLAFNSWQRVTAVPNKYLFNSKERITDLDLNWDDFGARMYMSDIGRWGVIDPLADQAPAWSQYNAMWNNPVLNVDPDGAWANPIYDYGGNFLGTDDWGLQGEAIMMNQMDFTQGMAHQDALNSGTLFSDLGNLDRWNFMGKGYPHWQSLDQRPDWDGIVTINEGVAWAKANPGALDNPTADNMLYLDAGKMDFGSLSTSDFQEEGQILRVNLLYQSSVYRHAINDRVRNTTYSLGDTRVQLVSSQNQTIRVLNDFYDWDYHNGNAPKTLIRNTLIWGERWRTGLNDTHGIQIRTYGLGVLKN